MLQQRQNNFRENWRFQQPYLPHIRHLLQMNASSFIRVNVASAVEDMKQSTDMVLKIEGDGTVAVRIRRPNCVYRDLTLRSSLSNGAVTELVKIRDRGFADWYLYAWTNTHDMLTEWILVDLNCVRASGILSKPRKQIPNGDGTFFISVGIPELQQADALCAGIVKGIRYGSNLPSIDVKGGAK